jgi:hypothetical protein
MKKVFDTAWKNKKDRGWEKIYVLVDVHDCIMHSNYSGASEKIIEKSIDPLRLMSADPRFCLIMWTCSSPEHGEIYLERFKKLGIKFDYYGENPEVRTGTGYGYYEQKPYCSIGIDDKFGFDWSVHWDEIHDWLVQNL